GFYTAVDPTDHNIVITESQDGNTNRYDLRTGRGTSVRPTPPPAPGRGGAGRAGGAGRGGAGRAGAAAEAEAQARPAPPVQVGGVSYSTIVSISESPILPGVVWAGTDDGNLQLSRDGGQTFTEVGKNLPGLPPNHQHWISRVDASHFDAGTAYVTVDGHRSDD